MQLPLKRILIVMLIFTNNVYSASKSEDINWGEEFKIVEGTNALNWVKNQNALTMTKLDGQQKFNSFVERTYKILSNKARIAYPSTSMDGYYHNFWQDDVSIKGLWRRIKPESYFSANPVWETILDMDKLSESEKENWVYKSNTKYKDKTTGHIYSLVELSRGGKDAVEIREFDIDSKTFVKDGFFIPEAKSVTSWFDENTLQVATDFGPGSLSQSGYPIVVKMLKRGQSVDSAATVFTGAVTDLEVAPFSVETEHARLHFIVQSLDFYNSYMFYLKPTSEGQFELIKVLVPQDAKFMGHFKEDLLFQLKSDWDYKDQVYKSDSIISIKIADLTENKPLQITNIFTPNGLQAIHSLSIAKNNFYIELLDNVNGKIIKFSPSLGAYTSKTLNLPKNGTVSVTSSDSDSDEIFLTYEDFLQPKSLYHYDSTTNDLQQVKMEPVGFDAKGLVVEQLSTISNDGTAIPYYMVHKKDMLYNGKNPTLLYGYGGFEISLTPGYNAVIGKNWLEEGGVYVLSNIRGGGEFGAKWHNSVLKESRQKSYDDFTSVATNLIERGITSPRYLGIEGGSNGGLLVGVTFTQRPDLFNAVVCSVPLLDMLNYHTLLAGASWMAEYGNPDDPIMRPIIQSYSPVQNLKADVTYPEVLFTTSTKDDRVHPYHARIMAQTMLSLGHKIYYFEDTDGGHGKGANLKKAAANSARKYIYLHEKLMQHD